MQASLYVFFFYLRSCTFCFCFPLLSLLFTIIIIIVLLFSHPPFPFCVCVVCSRRPFRLSSKLTWTALKVAVSTTRCTCVCVFSCIVTCLFFFLPVLSLYLSVCVPHSHVLVCFFFSVAPSRLLLLLCRCVCVFVGFGCCFPHFFFSPFSFFSLSSPVAFKSFTAMGMVMVFHLEQRNDTYSCSGKREKDRKRSLVIHMFTSSFGVVLVREAHVLVKIKRTQREKEIESAQLSILCARMDRLA